MLLSLALLSSAAIMSATSVQIQNYNSRDSRDRFPGIGEYLYDGFPRNWTEAFQYCTGRTGHLAVINSEAEENVIRTMLVNYGVATIHLGFHDRYAEGRYYTVTDEPITASQWAVGSPKGGSAYNCGGYSSAGLEDTDCAKQLTTICEYPQSSMYGYSLLPGLGYYKYHPEERTWSDAWEICKAEGAYLNILNSQAEADALFAQFNHDRAWVGVHRVNANTNEQFHTIFDVPLESTGYSVWIDVFQPWGSFLTNPYVFQVKNTGLAAHSSSFPLSFICEISL